MFADKENFVIGIILDQKTSFVWQFDINSLP